MWTCTPVKREKNTTTTKCVVDRGPNSGPTPRHALEYIHWTHSNEYQSNHAHFERTQRNCCGDNTLTESLPRPHNGRSCPLKKKKKKKRESTTIYSYFSDYLWLLLSFWLCIFHAEICIYWRFIQRRWFLAQNIWASLRVRLCMSARTVNGKKAICCCGCWGAATFSRRSVSQRDNKAYAFRCVAARCLSVCVCVCKRAWACMRACMSVWLCVLPAVRVRYVADWTRTARRYPYASQSKVRVRHSNKLILNVKITRIFEYNIYIFIFYSFIYIPFIVFPFFFFLCLVFSVRHTIDRSNIKQKNIRKSVSVHGITR